MQDLPKRNQLNAPAKFLFVQFFFYSIVNDYVSYRQSHRNVSFVSAEFGSSKIGDDV